MLRLDRPGAESVLREYGVRFGYENHPERSPQEVLELIGDADDVLGAAVDTGWWATQGYDPVQAIRDLRARLFHVHLKDVEAPDTHISCMHGEGVARIADCVDELLDSGYRAALSVEHEPFDRDPTGEVIRMRGLLEAQLAARAGDRVFDRAASFRDRRLRQHLRPLRRDGQGLPERRDRRRHGHRPGRSVRRSSSGSEGSTTRHSKQCSPIPRSTPSST